MGFFSRNKEALEATRAVDAPFVASRRTSRNSRKPRAPIEGDLDQPPPLDPAETAKTRARRRLIGAIALAAAAVVFVPMLFDGAPVAPSDDIALTIPDRDTPFEGRKGLPDGGRAPLKASPDLPVPSSSGSAPAVEPAPASAAETPVDRDSAAASASDARGPAKAPPAKSAEKSALPTTIAEKAAPPRADDPRALAALEGRPESRADITAAPAGKGFAVQVAAYSSADKARTMRDTLVANGMRSYTESVSTPQGLRTRVRLGPFASRDAADHAKERLRTMKLDGSVVPL